MKVRVTSPEDYKPPTTLPPKLHLAGMQLFGDDGNQIPASRIAATLSSTLFYNGITFDASRCNPGSSSAAGYPNFCHTALDDSDPSITFEYPCSEGLTEVHVANNPDTSEE